MTVRTEIDGPVTTIIHSRPEARNAMDPESADALVAAFKAFEADPEAHAAVLWGEGGAFCAGWDLKYAASLAEGNGIEELKDELAIPEVGEMPRGPLGRKMLTKLRVFAGNEHSHAAQQPIPLEVNA